VFGGGELAEGDAEVVGVVEGVKEILVCAGEYGGLGWYMCQLTEGMNILQSWEAIEDSLELFAECLLCELDLSRVEI